MAQSELCFIAFLIVPLIKSFNNSQKLSKETYLFSERRKVKYLISTFGFLERGDLLTVSSSPLLFSPNLASSAMSTDIDKFLADLVIELVPLSTSAFSAMFDSEFSADVIVVILSIEVSGLANLLKP